eukprot:11216114-Lingulodinium_polyedra.AAC.1
MTGPATHPGTPARDRAASTWESGTLSKALRQSSAAPATASPAASAVSSSIASSQANSAAPRGLGWPPHVAAHWDQSCARPAAQTL